MFFITDFSTPVLNSDESHSNVKPIISDKHASVDGVALNFDKMWLYQNQQTTKRAQLDYTPANTKKKKKKKKKVGTCASNLQLLKTKSGNQKGNEASQIPAMFI